MYFASILTLFIGIYFLGGLTLFSCRHSTHFKYRFPILTYLMSFHLLGKGTLDVFKLTGYGGFAELNCYELYWLNRITIMPFYVLFPFSVGLFMLVYRSHTTLQVPRLACKLFNIRTDKFVIQKLPWYVYLLAYTISIALPILIYLIDLASGVLENLDKTFPLNGATICTGPSNYSSVVVNGIYCVVGIVLFFKLKKYEDGLGIQKQYRIMAILYTPIFIILMILNSVFFDNSLPFSMNAFFSFLYNFFELVCLFYLPLYFHGSYRHAINKMRMSIKYSITEMHTLFQNPSYRRMFFIYAGRHLSSNYLLFLDKFDDLKKCKSDAVYNVKSKELFDAFISKDACFYVKIPKELFRELKSYKIYPKAVLDGIHNHVKEYIFDNLYFPFMNDRE